VHRHVYYTFL